MATLADRNNNPGNLRDPKTGSFRQFSSPQEGYAALLNDLQTKISGDSQHGLTPTSTLADFAKVYAPPTENETGQYVANLANKMGVRPDTTLQELQPKIGLFADAIASNEGYSGVKMPKIQPQTEQPTEQPAQPEQKSLSGFAGNVIKSGAGLLGGIWGAVTHPIDTLKNINAIGSGAAATGIGALTGREVDTPQTRQFKAVMDFYNQKYGIGDILKGDLGSAGKKIGTTLYEDPVGVAADASMFLSGGAGLAGKAADLSEAAKAARLVRGGFVPETAALATKGGSALRPVAAGLSAAGEAVNPLSVPFKASNIVSKGLTKSAEKSMTDVFAPTKEANKFLTKSVVSGKDVTLPGGETFRVPGMVERGLVGSSREAIAEKIASNIEDVGKKYAAAEEKIPGTTKLEIQPILDQMEEAKKQFIIEGEQGPVIVDKAAVQNLSDFQKITSDLSSNGLISKDSLTRLKQLWQSKIKKSGAYYGKTLEEGSKIDMLSEAENAIRNQLNAKFPDVAKINAEYTFWKNAEKVMEDTIKRKTGQSGIVRHGIYQGLGAIAGSPLGLGGVATGAYAMRLLSDVIASPAWKTTSSLVKSRIANALANNRFAEANKIILGILQATGRVEQATAIQSGQ